MDYLARRLALGFLSTEDRASLGSYSLDEQARQIADSSHERPRAAA